VRSALLRYTRAHQDEGMQTMAPGPLRRTLLSIATVTISLATLAPATIGHASTAPHKKHASFGAKLSTQSQPSNAFDGQPCEPKTVKCTRVMTQAYRRTDPETQQRAPKNGTIGTIEIVAGVPGTFTLQIVKAKIGSQKAKLIRNGPTIHYKGQGTGSQDNGPPYTIESFKVNVPVEKGDYLAVRATKISFEYCSGGGGAQFTYEPPLTKSEGYRHTNHTDGCLMLLEAIYK
jgi:hypothetical protein